MDKIILEKLDNEMNELNTAIDNMYSAEDRDYKREVELHLELENCYEDGVILVDNLIDVALTQRKFIRATNRVIKDLILDGKYDEATKKLEKTRELINFARANSAAGKIREEMQQIIDS